MIHKIGDLILEHLDELAQLESLDNGKPFSVARVADVPLSADMFHYMSGWATKIEGKHIPISHLVSPGEYLSFTRPEPIGVVGQIIPWNFPLLMAAWKLAPGAGHRLHRGAEGGGRNAAVRRCRLGELLHGSRPSRWRGQYRARLWRNRRRGAGLASRCRQGRLHRLDRSGPADRAGGLARPAQGEPGTGRQIAQHHPGRCRYRRRHRRRHRRHLLQPWPVLQCRLAPVRAGESVRQGGGGHRRQCREDQAGRRHGPGDRNGSDGVGQSSMAGSAAI